MTDRERRDENTAGGNPADANGLEDEVLIDGPAKLAHEDTPASAKEIESEDVETRAGTDIEGGKTARELRDEREDAAREHREDTHEERAEMAEERREARD